MDSTKMALDALKFAEAALADIGDADREPGDDLAWCEARAAEALPRTRAAIAALQAEPQPETERDAFKAVARKLVRGYAARASSGATTQAVRMLTEDEQAAIIDMHSTGRAQGDHECAEAIQRKFCEVNAGCRIPEDGKLGGSE